MRNWKTTGLGVCLLLGAIGSCGTAILDGDPETVPQWQELIAALAGLGLFFAREESQHRNDALKLLFGGLCLVPLLALAGCATPSASNVVAVGGDTKGLGTPSNIATMDTEGRQVASFQDGLPTLVKQDTEGAWLNTPGQGGAVVLNMGETSAYVWSPLDGEIEELNITADGVTVLQLKGLKFNVSAHAAVIAQMYAAGVQATLGMTQAEATRRLEELKAVGTITGDVLAKLVEVWVPTLTP